MTERGLPSVDGAPACPFVAFEHDRDARATSPDHRHRCFAEQRPAPRALAHQEAYCLSSAFPVCPTFQDWARREAAAATGAGVGAPASAAGPGRGESDGRGGYGVGAAAGLAAAGGAAGAAMAGGAAAGDAASGAPSREPILRTTRASSGDPEWPSAPAWPAADLARRHAARIEADTDEDVDDSQAPRFVTDRADPGRGLAGSPADRYARAAEPAVARPAWPASDDGTPGRSSAEPSAAGAVAGSAAGAAAGAAAAGAATAPRGRYSSAAAGTGVMEPGYRRDVDDDFYADRNGPAQDYGRAGDRAEPMDAATRDEPKRRGLFGRDKRPKVGDTRRDIADEPTWEQPRRYEAYPTLKTRRGLPVTRLVVAILALVAAAVGFFLLPGLLGVGNPVLPSPTASVAASPTQVGASTAPSASESLAPTAVPTPGPLTYTVVRGDTLTKVAKKFNVTVDQIMAANPQIKNPNQVNVGDVIVIPTGAASPAP